VAAHIVRQFGTSTGSDVSEPAGTIMADGGGKVALAECTLSEADQAGAQRVAAFIAKYYSAAEHGQSLHDPLHTVTSKPRFGLVTVNGWPIVDIGLRMLSPRELYRAQGFSDDYKIDVPGPNGKPLTKTAQVRMCGNSVCPPIAEALVRANVGQVAEAVAA
jgi:DNA (cytosine-5)-methyltransferase 1